jgi:hypothetical protein
MTGLYGHERRRNFLFDILSLTSTGSLEKQGCHHRGLYNRQSRLVNRGMSAQVARSNLLGHTIYLSVEKFKHTQGK